MPKIKYIAKEFSDEKTEFIETCNQIVNEYSALGFHLTLRQLYYRLVASDKFPEDRKYSWTGKKWVQDPAGTNNAMPNYTWLGDIMNDARLAGLVDWHALEDRTRNLDDMAHWTDPQHAITDISRTYRNDLWRWQPVRLQVWVEKDALEDVVARACRPYDVPFFSCRGYTSQTAMWEASQRFLKCRKTYSEYDGKHPRPNGQRFRQKPYILHLGDHDPSGIDMTRDIQDRLNMFVGEPVKLKRIALTMDQINKYNPPPNPAKTTDSRFASYVKRFGDSSWELDALSPTVLVNLIQGNIKSIMDKERFDEAKAIQEKGREQLKLVANRWDAALAGAGYTEGAL